MTRSSIAAMAAVLALTLAGAASAFAATSDSQTSSADPKLSCKVSITENGGKLVVSWTITGASSASVEPLSFKGGKVPLKGSQTVDGPTVDVKLTAKDAAGNVVTCTADLTSVMSMGSSSMTPTDTSSSVPPPPPPPPPTVGGSGPPNKGL